MAVGVQFRSFIPAVSGHVFDEEARRPVFQAVCRMAGVVVQHLFQVGTVGAAEAQRLFYGSAGSAGASQQYG